MIKSSGFKRIISLFVVVCFLATNAMAMPAQELGATRNVQRATDILSLSLPSGLGIVAETYTAPDERYGVRRTAQKERGTRDTLRRTVIYIQDAHDSLEAQENIAAMVRHCVKEYGVKTVYEEGYEGPVPTDKLFGSITDAAFKEKISYYLMDKLRLGGAEYAFINRTTVNAQRSTKDLALTVERCAPRTDWQLIGADSINLHLENIRAYEQAAKHRSGVTQDIERIRKELQKLIDRNFPKEFKEWLKLKERFTAGQMLLVEYLQRTRNAQRAMNMLRETESVEGGYKQVDSLLSGDENQIKKIGLISLLSEIRALEDAIVEKGLSSERDRKTYGYFQSVLLLEKLNAIQLSAEEFEALKSSLKGLKTEDVACFLAKESRRSLVLFKSWEDLIADSINFYELAKKRDEAIASVLADSVERRADRQEAPAPRSALHAEVSILVFGGFHKEAIKKILKEKGISYVILSPAMGAPNKRHEAYYRMLMSGGRHAFETPASVSKGPTTRDQRLPTKNNSLQSPVSSPQSSAGAARESNRPANIFLHPDAAAIVSRLAEVAAPLRSELRQDFILKMDRTLERGPETQELIRSEARSGSGSFSVSKEKVPDPLDERQGQSFKLGTVSARAMRDEETEEAIMGWGNADQRPITPEMQMQRIRAKEASLVERARVFAREFPKYPWIDWENAAKVSWNEIVREPKIREESGPQAVTDFDFGASENRWNYWANQIDVREALLVMLADELRHVSSGGSEDRFAPYERAKEYLLKAHAWLLLGKRGDSPYMSPTAIATEGLITQRDIRLLVENASVSARNVRAYARSIDQLIKILTERGRTEWPSLAQPLFDLYISASFSLDPMSRGPYTFEIGNHSFGMAQVNGFRRLFGKQGVRHGDFDRKNEGLGVSQIFPAFNELMLEADSTHRSEMREKGQGWTKTDMAAALTAGVVFSGMVLGLLFFRDEITRLVLEAEGRITDPVFLRKTLTSVPGAFAAAGVTGFLILTKRIPKMTEWLVRKFEVRPEGVETYLKTLAMFFSVSSFADKVVKVFLGLLFIRYFHAGDVFFSAVALDLFLFSGWFVRVLSTGAYYAITQDPHLRRIGWLSWIGGLGAWSPLLFIFGPKMVSALESLKRPGQETRVGPERTEASRRSEMRADPSALQPQGSGKPVMTVWEITGEVREFLSQIQLVFFRVLAEKGLINKKRDPLHLIDVRCVIASQILARLIAEKFDIPMGGDAPVRIGIVKGVYTKKGYGHVWNALYAGSSEPALFIDGSYGQFQNFYEGAILAEDYGAALHGLDLKEISRTPLLRLNDKQLKRAEEAYSALRKALAKEGLLTSPGRSQFADDIWEQALAAVHRKPAADFTRTEHANLRYALARGVAKQTGEQCPGVAKIWLVGSVAAGGVDTVGPESDIDLVVEVTSEAARREAVRTLRLIDRALVMKFNGYFSSHTVPLDKLLDITGKVFLKEEIAARKGFAGLVQSLYEPPTLLFQRAAGPVAAEAARSEARDEDAAEAREDTALRESVRAEPLQPLAVAPQQGVQGPPAETIIKKITWYDEALEFLGQQANGQKRPFANVVIFNTKTDVKFHFSQLFPAWLARIWAKEKTWGEKALLNGWANRLVHVSPSGGSLRIWEMKKVWWWFFPVIAEIKEKNREKVLRKMTGSETLVIADSRAFSLPEASSRGVAFRDPLSFPAYFKKQAAPLLQFLQQHRLNMDPSVYWVTESAEASKNEALRDDLAEQLRQSLDTIQSVEKKPADSLSGLFREISGTEEDRNFLQDCLKEVKERGLFTLSQFEYIKRKVRYKFVAGEPYLCRVFFDEQEGIPVFHVNRDWIRLHEKKKIMGRLAAKGFQEAEVRELVRLKYVYLLARSLTQAAVARFMEQMHLLEGEAGIYHEREKRAVALLADTEFLHASRGDAQKILRFSKLVKMLDPETDMALFVEDRQLRKDFLNNHRSYQELLQEILDGRFYALTFSGEPRWLKSIHRFLDHEKHAYKVHKTENTENLKASQSASRKDLKSFRRILRYKRLFRNYMTYWLPQEMNVEQISKLGYANEWTLELNGNSIPVLLNHTFPYDYNAKRLSENLSKDVGGVTFLEATIANIHRKKILPEQVQKIYIRPLDKQSNFKFCFYVMVVTSEGVFDFALLLAQPVPRWEGGVGFKDFLVDGEAELKTIQKASERDPEIGLTLGAYYQGDQITTGDFFSIRYAGRDLKRILTQPHDQLKDHARADFLQNIFARYLRSYYRMGGYQCVIDIKPSNVASLDLIVRIVDYGINAYDGKIAVMSAVINGLLDETSDFGKMWHFPPYTDDRKYIFSGILEAFTNDKKPNDPEFHYRLALGLEFLRQIREDPYDVLTEKAKKAINDFFADNRSWRDFKRLDHLSSAQTKIEEGPWPVVDKDYQNLGPVPDIRFEKIDEELYQTNDPKKVSYAFLARLAGVSVPSDLKTLPHDQVIRLLDHILLDHLVLPDEIYLGILKALAQRYQVQNESIPDRKTYRAFLRVLKEQAAMALDNKSLPTRKVKVTVLDADLVRKLSITQIELLLRKFIEVPDSYTPLLGNAENDFAKEAVLIADLTEMAELKNASLRKLLQQARLKYDRLTSGKGQVEEKGSPPVDSAQPGQARSEMRQAKVVTTRSPWKYFWMLQRAGWAEKGPAIAGGAALWMLGSSQEGLIGLFAKVLAGAVLAKPFYLTVFYFIHEMGHFFYEKAVGGEPEFRFYPATLNTQVSPDKFNHLTLSHHRKIWGSGFALSFPFLIMMNAIVWLGARETFLITLAGMCAALEGRYFWRFDGRSLLVSLLDPEAAVESIIIAGLEKNRVHQKPVAFGTSQPPFNDPRRAEMRSPDQAVKMLMVAARIAQEQDDRDFGPGRLVKGMVAAFRNERPYQDAEARLLAAAKKFLAEDAPAVPENDKGWEALLDHPQAYECFLIAKKNEGAAKRSEVRESLTGDAEALPATPHHLSTVALFHKLGDSGEELSREDAYWLNRRVNGPAYSKEVVEVNFGAVITKLRELLGELRGKSIVEIGCGDGMLLRYLSEELGMEVRGIEKSPFALNLARTENGLAGKVWGPEEQGNIRDGFADVVLSVRVLEPLIMLEYQATSVIRSLDAMLKRGGLQMHVTSDTPHIEALVKAGYSKVDHSGLPPFNHCVWARKPFHRTGHSRSELRAPEMPRDPMVEEVNRITSTPGLSKVTLSLLKVARWLSPDFNGLFVLVGVGRDIQENLKVIAEALPNAHVLGIDYDAGVVKAAQKALAGFPEAVRSRIRVEQGNAKNLRELLEDETAGVVYFESVFGLYGQNDDRHQALLHAMIRESHRILRPGGLLVISDAYAGLRSDRIVDDLGFESLSREGGLYSLIVKKPALSQSAGPAGPRAEVHVATDGTFAARQKSSDAVRMAEETAQARSEMRASGVAGTLARLAIPADAVVAQRPGIGRIIDLGRLSLSFEETGSLAGELAALEKEAFDGREAFGQRDDWMRALEKPSAVLILLNEKNELTGFSFVRPASAFFENKLQRIVSKKDNVKGKGTFLMDAVLSRLYHKKETHLVWGSYWRVSDDFYQDYIARGEALGFLEDAGSLGRDFSINIIADPLAPVRRPRKMVRGRSENENSADKIDGRVLAASKTHRAEVRDAIENMKGKFTIVTDLADVAQFTDKQLEEFEVMAVLQPNVKFVFHGDRDEVISRDARKRLEKLQAELGADRIVITEGGIGDLAMNKGEKVIQISKSGTEYRVRSAEAKLSRRNPYALRRTAKIFSFRYLGEETGLVPMALLYADQHEQPSPKGMMDLSMAGAALRVAIQEFHNSIVFARAA